MENKDEGAKADLVPTCMSIRARLRLKFGITHVQTLTIGPSGNDIGCTSLVAVITHVGLQETIDLPLGIGQEFSAVGEDAR